MMKPSYWLVLGIATVGAVQVAACSSSSHSCEETRTCGTAEAGAGQGEAGEAAGADSSGGGNSEAEGSNEAGASGEAGGSNEAGASGEAGAAGEAGAGSNATPKLFGTCSTLGANACQGHAGAQRLACDGEKWQAGTTCAQGQLCDSTTGDCAVPVPECVGAEPGATLCRGDIPLTCGPDLVTATEGQECAGICKLGLCEAPVCGDSKTEPGEDCDVGDTDNSGMCAKCMNANCGDGSLHLGVEQCDDGNKVAGDGCSPTCTLEPIAVAAGSNSTCALSKIGTVKCWGYNGNGELGIGSTISHGDGSATGGMGKDLPLVDFGVGRTAKSISVGLGAACAILENGNVKCWGINTSGELGTGTAIDSLGKSSGDVANAPSIQLERPATSVVEGWSYTCSLSDSGEARCWGHGARGELGQDDGIPYSGPQYLTGPINLGAKATALSAGPSGTTCAILANGTAKCWGLADDGALSVATDLNKGAANTVGNHLVIGDYKGPGAPQGEMALLPALNLGGSASVVQIGSSATSTCALLADGNVKCWGTNTNGILGTGVVGGKAGTTPDALIVLPPVDLGSGRKATSIAVGSHHVCAIVDYGGVKCWGANTYGQLGIGNIENIGDGPNEMGDHLGDVPLAGHKALQISAGDSHTCAVLDNGKAVCWGYNGVGQLGIGSTKPLGDAPGFQLQPVDLVF